MSLGPHCQAAVSALIARHSRDYGAHWSTTHVRPRRNVLGVLPKLCFFIILKIIPAIILFQQQHVTSLPSTYMYRQEKDYEKDYNIGKEKEKVYNVGVFRLYWSISYTST